MEGKKIQTATLKIMAVLENYDDVVAFVEGQLETFGCAGKAAIQIQTAVEEVFVNIASYAYHPGKGETEITVWNTENPDQVWVRFIDGGIPFNPLNKPDPNILLEAEEREIGGLGIYMVKESMDSVTYVYEGQKNTLTFGKSYERQGKG